jgi:hypothetical protein
VCFASHHESEPQAYNFLPRIGSAETLQLCLAESHKENRPMASPWKKLNNTPPFSVDTMLLLTDGSIMCHELETAN